MISLTNHDFQWGRTVRSVQFTQMYWVFHFICDISFLAKRNHCWRSLPKLCLAPGTYTKTQNLKNIAANTRKNTTENIIHQPSTQYNTSRTINHQSSYHQQCNFIYTSIYIALYMIIHHVTIRKNSIHHQNIILHHHDTNPQLKFRDL